MRRVEKDLNPIDVKRLKDAGYHAVGHVAGLTLQITPSGARSWLLRATVGGKRREIGLGSYPAVSLALAREKAQAMRDKIVSGTDPVAERKTARQAIIQQQKEEERLRWKFRRCAEAYIEAHAAGWRNTKHKSQWVNTLETYVYPKIGDMLVRDIQIRHVIDVIQPHWTTKTETMSRVRHRIEMVLDWATAREYRMGENPARWKGKLNKLLPAPKKVARRTHHRALAANDMYDFVSRLRKVDGMGARCLEFVILTACRSGEARLATWDEIDFKSKTWKIPAERMKSERAHSVPLSEDAIQLLKSLPRMEGTNFIFFGRKASKPLSDMTMTKVMRDMNVDAVPHGFRATFSTWCAESTSYPFEVREMALAHAIGDETVEAYMRSDLFEKRRNLMRDWAKFINFSPPSGDNVVPLISA